MVLVVLAGVAGASLGFAPIAPSLAVAALAASVVDAPILRARGRWWTFPDGAILTGLFVAMVLSRFEPWYVVAATSIVAVLGKHVFRGRTANVFNPAALGIVVTFYAIGTGQDWWGALADAGFAGLVVLVATGLFIVDRVNKMPLVLTFLGAYFLLFTTMAFAGEPSVVAEIFRPPDVNAVLFFAFFILTDPPTSPIKYRDQVICGAIVAVASFAIFETVGAAHYLLSGVLVGNVWEAWRRRASRRPVERASRRD
jgi:Na+-translocating ferredoxin:NAD+ oxidoreductase RnfD subunit